MTTPKKKYASKDRYDKNHPIVSARLTTEVRDKLRTVLKRQGITLADALTTLANVYPPSEE